MTPGYQYRGDGFDVERGDPDKAEKVATRNADQQLRERRLRMFESLSYDQQCEMAYARWRIKHPKSELNEQEIDALVNALMSALESQAGRTSQSCQAEPPEWGWGTIMAGHCERDAGHLGPHKFTVLLPNSEQKESNGTDT